jgi:hypothetical protein
LELGAGTGSAGASRKQRDEELREERREQTREGDLKRVRAFLGFLL